MTIAKSRAARRRDALSKAQILEAATALLDGANTAGQAGGLTLRALMDRLSTGSGAIYHYVADMDELRAAASDDLLRRRLEPVSAGGDPTGSLRAVAVGIFDAIAAHPWLGIQLTRDPLQPAVFRIWRSIALPLSQLGLEGALLMDAGSTLANFILGSATRQKGDDRSHNASPERAERLALVADHWTDSDKNPLVADIAGRLRNHDDRKQFQAGIDLILRGILSSID